MSTSNLPKAVQTYEIFLGGDTRSVFEVRHPEHLRIITYQMFAESLNQSLRNFFNIRGNFLSLELTFRQFK